jgi:3-dehydroshikimate dehydratase
MTDLKPIVPGLCSVAFRSLDALAVIRLALENNLQAIEWGSDVHLPVGDNEAARLIRSACADAGLTVSYGSYFTAGRPADAGEVSAVIETAHELGAGNVRVWADGPEVVDDLRAICAVASSAGMTVSVEYHPGTCTENAASTNDLLDKVQAENLRTYWQPDPTLPIASALDDLEAVLPRLSHLHVFSWEPDYARCPLDAGEDLWTAALLRVGDDVPNSPPHTAFIEFVRDDSPEQLQADAATLLRWLS